jgi:hypothetical protein
VILAPVWLQQTLHQYLVKDPAFRTRPHEALTRTCLRVDEEILEMCEREGLFSGTTALMVLIR